MISYELLSHHSKRVLPHWRPAVDVYRTAMGWLLKFDLAGVHPDDIVVEVHGRRVLVSGVRRDLSLQTGYTQYRLEIPYSRFAREIELPSELPTAVASADMCDGMFLLRIEAIEETGQ